MPQRSSWCMRCFVPYVVTVVPASASSGPSAPRTVSSCSCRVSPSSRGACPTGTYQARPGSVAKARPRRSRWEVSPVVDSAEKPKLPAEPSASTSSLRTFVVGDHRVGACPTPAPASVARPVLTDAADRLGKARDECPELELAEEIDHAVAVVVLDAAGSRGRNRSAGPCGS